MNSHPHPVPCDSMYIRNKYNYIGWISEIVANTVKPLYIEVSGSKKKIRIS